MAREDLRGVIDYILNRADPAEIEVIVKAVQRRQRDAHLYAKIGGVSPGRAAKETAARVSEQLGATKESLEGLVRGFIQDIIQKNAPGIPQADLAAVTEHYMRSGKDSGSAAGANALPSEAILAMVKRFVSYSSGAMAPSEQKALWDEMPRWQDAYWKAFPAEVKAFVEAFLAGKLGQEEFWAALLGYLGL
jgi:hypothetical protein